jgi:hypothetical protein
MKHVDILLAIALASPSTLNKGKLLLIEDSLIGIVFLAAVTSAGLPRYALRE